MPNIILTVNEVPLFHTSYFLGNVVAYGIATIVHRLIICTVNCFNNSSVAAMQLQGVYVLLVALLYQQCYK